MKNPEKTNLEKFKELLKDIHSCILITRALDGELDGRPMATTEVDEEGNLWFFTNDYSKKVKEIAWDNKVYLTFASQAQNSYVVINGIASISNDQEKMKQLWNPLLKAWFPGGLEDPGVALLKIEPYRVEYWEGSSGKAVTGFNILKSIVTGKEYNQGEHERIVL